MRFSRRSAVRARLCTVAGTPHGRIQRCRRKINIISQRVDQWHQHRRLQPPRRYATLTARITHSILISNQAVGGAGSSRRGEFANGDGIDANNMAFGLEDRSVISNGATGGQGGSGGDGGSASGRGTDVEEFATKDLTASNCCFSVAIGTQRRCSFQESLTVCGGAIG